MIDGFSEHLVPFSGQMQAISKEPLVLSPFGVQKARSRVDEVNASKSGQESVGVCDESTNGRVGRWLTRQDAEQHDFDVRQSGADLRDETFDTLGDLAGRGVSQVVRPDEQHHATGRTAVQLAALGNAPEDVFDAVFTDAQVAGTAQARPDVLTVSSPA